MFKDVNKKRLYQIWYTMKRRCDDPNINDYYRYGGRGVTYCSEWEDFNLFYNWSILNDYKEGLTLDRINNDGNYEPNNCQWVDWLTQQNKRSNNVFINYNGCTLTAAQWSRKLGISKEVIYYRLKHGWTIDKVLNTPSRQIR